MRKLLENIVTAIIIAGMVPMFITFCMEGQNGEFTIYNAAGIAWLLISALWFLYKPLNNQEK